MSAREVISVFEYRRRKAEAAMRKAEAQEAVVQAVMQAGFRRPYAEEIAEAGRDVRASGAEEDFSAQEAAAVNVLLAQVREHEQAGYLLEQTTTLY